MLKNSRYLWLTKSQLLYAEFSQTNDNGDSSDRNLSVALKQELALCFICLQIFVQFHSSTMT